MKSQPTTAEHESHSCHQDAADSRSEHDHHAGSADDHASAGHNHGAHGHHDHGDHVGMFRRRFWWSLLLTLPIVVTSHMVMDWFGYELNFYGMEWVGPVLGSVVYFWAGWPFLNGGYDEARAKQPGMMLLIAMAITVAYAASLATSLHWFDLEFWWELAALIPIMLLGHWQEMKALGQAQDALAALAKLLPDEAERVSPDGNTETILLSDLQIGDVVLVRPGGRVPADGKIVEGNAEFDESMITGESRPVSKGAGDNAIAGTVVTDSSVRIRTAAVGDDTALAGIQRLVDQAQSSKSNAQALADRAAAMLFYVAVSAAVVTFVGWTLAGEINKAVEFTVGVLVISCPHALGLAIPLVISLSSAIAARNGILVKDRLALEKMRNIDSILFDKTGTLTTGAHSVTGFVAAEPYSEAEIFRIASAVESDSEHPLARAMVTAAEQRNLVGKATEFRSLTGRGVEASVDGKQYAVGGPALLRERKATIPDSLSDEVANWKSRGASVLFLLHDSEILAAFQLEDKVRPEAREAVRELHRLKRQVTMITGDADQVAKAVAGELSIDDVFSEVLPEDKASKVVALQERSRRVAMVGDGVNDAPALASADVGIAIGAGTDVAIESAGVILASSDPRSVVGVIRLSQASYRKMMQNLFWAAGYNVLAIPLAGGALAWAGFTLSPAIGAVLMSVSTIVVALNAQTLRKLDLSYVALDANNEETSATHRLTR